MLKKLAFLGLFSTISTLSTHSAAQAAIIWDWSFGGTESVRITTTGNITDLGSANTFTVTDFTVSSSSEPSIVGANFINNSNTIVQGVQGFIWDGSQITQVFRNGGNQTNGANFYSGGFGYVFSVNSSSLENADEDTLVFEGAFNPTPSAPNPQSVPEPATILGLLTFGAAALGSRRKWSK